MDLRNFLAELKRRSVYKVAAAYAVVAWLLIQAASILFPTFEAPGWVMKVFVAVVAAGFPLALIFAWAFELTPQGIKRTEDVAANESITRRTGRKLAAGIAVLAVIAAGLLAYQMFRRTSSETPQPKSSGATTISDNSIAVLPFENLSDDKSNAYFASGIQDEILTRLSKIGALKVISRSSTKQYESKPGNLREVGQQLGAANILEGSVQKAGDVVHINVQLIRAATDEHIWAESYNRKLDDIFAVQAELAGAVADALQAKLTGAEKKAIEARPTENLGAYAAYLRGAAIEADYHDFPAYQRAAAEYAEAVRQDPHFALAWARLAIVRSFLSFNGIDLAANSADAIKEAANRAFALQPDLAEAWLAQGAYRYRTLRDFSGAMRAYEEARKRLPGSSYVFRQMGAVERRLGRWRDAVTHLRQAIELDPRNLSLLAALGGEFLFPLRRNQEAHEVLDRALRIAPGSVASLSAKAALYQSEGRLDAAAKVLAQLAPDEQDDFVVQVRALQLIYERRFDAAIARLEIDTAPPPSGEALSGIKKGLIPLLGFWQEWAGRPADARRTFERAIREIKPAPDAVVPIDQTLLPMNLALAYAGDGDKERAMEAARGAISAYENDAMIKPLAETVLAQIQARFGEVDAAVAALPHLLEVPGHNPLTPALLRLDPMWDPLRNDPRFQKLAAGNP
jgi:TolB-like protein/Tfp pilus assembly protein PilF